MDKNKQLYRVSENKALAGVCTGLAEYFDMDVVVVRVLFVVAALILSPVVLVAYIILAVTMPLMDDLINDSETVGTVEEDEYKIDPNDY